LVSLLLKLLLHCCKIKVNRRYLLSIGAINVLLAKLKLVLSKESHADLAEHLLLIIESIVREANRTKEKLEYHLNQSVDEMEHVVTLEEGMLQMRMLLEKLSSSLVKSNANIVQTVCRIMPFLTYGEPKIIDLLIDYFYPYLDFEKYDATSTNKSTTTSIVLNTSNPTVNTNTPLEHDQTLHLECFSSVCENIRIDENGAKLKDAILNRGITRTLIQYLLLRFSPENNDPQSEAWTLSISLPSLEYVLRQLAGLCRFHSATQRLIFDSHLIPSIHRLEKTTTVKKIGNLAENLMEALLENDANHDIVQRTVEQIREEERKKNMEQAERYRQRVLKEMNLSCTGVGKVTASSVPFVKDFEEIEEEKGLKCMVCQDGYSFKPNDVLGFYTFAKRQPMNVFSNTGRQSSALTVGRPEFGYTSVSHFNVIHFQCHRDATHAERSLKPPKEEWEGATIRNQHTLCNNLFPIIGPATPIDSYTTSLEKYWTNLSNLGRCDSPRFRLLVHDLKFLLLYYANEESLSVHSHGGGRESNIKCIPFIVQMGLFLLDQKASAQRRTFERALQQFLMQPIEHWQDNSLQSDGALFMAVLSLFLLTLEEWQETRFLFLQRLLVCFYIKNSMERNEASPTSSDNNYNSSSSSSTTTTTTTSSSSSGSSSSGGSSNNNNNNHQGTQDSMDTSVDEQQKWFQICRPALLFFAMIDKLQKIFNKRSLLPVGRVTNEGLSTIIISHKSDEKWITELSNTLRTQDMALLDSMMVLLHSYETDMLVFESFQEFFDELDLLKVILASHRSELEFIRALLQSVSSRDPHT